MCTSKIYGIMLYIYNYIFHIPIEDLRDYPIRDHQD